MVVGHICLRMEGENVPPGKRKRNPVANSDSTFTSSRPKRFFIDALTDHVNVHSSLSLSLSRCAFLDISNVLILWNGSQLVIAIEYSLLLDMSKDEAVEYISTHAKVRPQAVGLGMHLVTF